MKNAVVTIVISEQQKLVNELTGPSHKAYADKIGAEYIEITESRIVSGEADHEIFQIFQLLNQFERIVYLDCFTLVREDCPDLFQEVPKTTLGVFNKAPFTPGANFIIDETFRDYGKRRDYWNGEYYDFSVAVISRQHKFAFKVPDEGFFHSSVERYINMKLCADIEMWKGGLKYQFNRMSAMDGATGEERYNSYIINYHEIPEVGLMLNYIKKDLQKWEIDKYNGYTGPSYAPHILLEAVCGLGDQIVCEPVFRRAMKLFPPNSDIRITTDYPRIFSGLEKLGAKITSRKGLVQDFDGSFFRRLGNPPQMSEFATHVDGILSPIVDFTSLSVLRRILSDEEKIPQLEIFPEDIESVLNVVGLDRPLEEYVLLHAGSHWTANRYPEDYWQEIADGISQAGVPLILIGKAMKEPIEVSYVKIEANGTMIDTRDLLDLGALFALISKACMLISNDSGPLHISHAFENDIVVLPTLKLPDHLLPVRHGSRTWRTKAFYKKLMIDDLPTAPNSIYGTVIETFDGGDIMQYLEDPKVIVKWVVKRYSDIKKGKI